MKVIYKITFHKELSTAERARVSEAIKAMPAVAKLDANASSAARTVYLAEAESELDGKDFYARIGPAVGEGIPFEIHSPNSEIRQRAMRQLNEQLERGLEVTVQYRDGAYCSECRSYPALVGRGKSIEEASDDLQSKILKFLVAKLQAAAN